MSEVPEKLYLLKNKSCDITCDSEKEMEENREFFPDSKLYIYKLEKEGDNKD